MEPNNVILTSQNNKPKLIKRFFGDDWKKILFISFVCNLLLIYPIYTATIFITDSYKYAIPTGVTSSFLDLLLYIPYLIIVFPLTLLSGGMGDGALGLALLAMAIIPFAVFMFWTFSFFIFASILRYFGLRSILLVFLAPFMFVVASNVVFLTYEPQESAMYKADQELANRPYVRATREEDYTICNEEKDTKNRDSCLRNFASGDDRTKNLEVSKTVCDLIEDNKTKLSCHISRGDSLTLEQCAVFYTPTSSEALYQICLSTYAFNNPNLETCDLPQYDDKVLKNSCLNQVSLATSNVDLCLKLENKYSQSMCYFNIVSKGKDPQLCNNVEEIYAGEPRMKNMCFRFVAETLKDRSVCEFITRPKKGKSDVYEMCISYKGFE